jgi:hypothetical protein
LWYFAGDDLLQVRALKAQSNSLADAASQAKLDLAAAQQERAALEDQVVQVRRKADRNLQQEGPHKQAGSSFKQALLHCVLAILLL